MRITTAVSTILAGMACVASAASLPPRSDPIRTYKLKVVAPSTSGINGKFLSIQPSGEVGVYSPNGVVQPKAGHGLVPPLAPSPDESTVGVPTPAQFSIATSKSHHYELHTYPTGIIDHALALNGTGGLLFLRDVANPAGAASDGPAGYKLDWQSFTLGGLSSNDRDDSDLAARAPPPLLANGLSYAGSQGRWILIQKGAGSYAAAWYDGTSIITQNYRPVDIAYVEA